MTRKIGILGGTFDPIHKGHLNIALKAYEKLSLDSVMFIPSGISYMKDHVTDASLRYHMTELAIKEYPFFTISDIEVRRHGNSYTYVTLEELNAEYPDTEFIYIVGADTFMNMDKWKCVGRIFRAASIAYYLRDDIPEKVLLAKEHDYKRIFNAKIFFLSGPQVDISSTDIKKVIKNGEKADAILTPSVYSYIKEHNLYL